MDQVTQQIKDDIAARDAIIERVTRRRIVLKPAARELTAMITYLTHLQPELVDKAMDYVVEDREHARAIKERVRERGALITRQAER